jgi:hypothetical protein
MSEHLWNSGVAMPVRSVGQLFGKQGEQLVEGLFDAHPRWLARPQNIDYGIDFEAELATPTEDGQALSGQLLKVQVKTRRRLVGTDTHVVIKVDREWIDYACAFRVPVILVAVEHDSKRCWWLWVQEWALAHEERLAADTRASLSVRIPADLRLDDQALGKALPAIAEGRPASSMVLALRGVLQVAHGWENQTIARGIVELLGRTQFPSRDWTIGKVVDELVRFGPGVPYWQAQQMLPILLALVENGADALSREQVIRMVKRGDSYSRVGLNALALLYDHWPDHAASLGLPHAFAQAGLGPVAWYTAMRERFSGKQAFGHFLAGQPDGDLNHVGLTLRIDQRLRDYLVSKWPNRADSVLLDCLFEMKADADPPQA